MEATTTTNKKKTQNKRHRGNGHRAMAASQRGREAAGVAEKTRSTVNSMAKSAVDAASYVSQKADDMTTAVGSALEDTGQYLRDDALKHMKNVATAVGSALEDTGQYLRKDGLKHMANDFTEMVRRNPIPALLMGIGLGFWVAHATNHRS